MDHRGGELTGDFVEVGEHQQQPLGGGEGGGEGPRLQRPVHDAGGAGLALHLHHLGHRAPEVGPALTGPAIGPLAHRRRRGDRVDRHHLVEAIGHPRHRFVAIDPRPGAGHGGSSPSSPSAGSPSSTARASPT